MATLVWDDVGERFYETGVDRGVLYPDGEDGVAWNGLVSVVESKGREVKSSYSDGVKYLDYQVVGAFTGKIQAFTYPDALEELTGTPEFAAGVFLHDQPSSTFGLCYRTKVGNDLDADLGYKIHLLYNVLATPADFTAASVSDKVAPNVFEWTLNAVPPALSGMRPTAHISIDSRTIDPELLSDIEDALYGTGLADPTLTPLETLLAQIETFYE